MRNPVAYARTAWRMARALRDPEQLQDILELAAVLAPPAAMRRLVERLMRHDSAARAFVERPRVGFLHPASLCHLPEGTLGRAYADHLLGNGLDPDALPALEAHTDEEYVRAHMLESHDVWHVLTGFHTDVAGELGIQAFSLAQVGSPFALGILAGGLANTLLYAFSERDVRMRAIVRGWLLGHRSRLLFGAPWRRMWELPLAEVRQRYGLDLAAVDAMLPGSADPAQSC
ncbi:Coq4 family protein [Pyxidicoccus sp. MSG2]|uniref:Coq4 family protein n=1 Tax=Pyxidicoccus sp. MSG2 TaxID=2996790 RepID=UPI00226E155D|nr:Coq4 family protein [Pyxidicoccus sp. MSG2]MCY1016734.1 Coq4 family protein [Pyxidicoccus sp. MSG2]